MSLILNVIRLFEKKKKKPNILGKIWAFAVYVARNQAQFQVQYLT